MGLLAAVPFGFAGTVALAVGPVVPIGARLEVGGSAVVAGPGAAVAGAAGVAAVVAAAAGLVAVAAAAVVDFAEVAPAHVVVLVWQVEHSAMVAT